MGKLNRIGHELYDGRRSIDFIGRKALWYAISVVLVGACLAIIFVKGLTFGIEFTGGVQYRVPVPAAEATQGAADETRELIGDLGIEGAETPVVSTAVGGEGTASILVQTEDIEQEGVDQIQAELAENFGVDQNEVSVTEIGATWGAEVAERALLGIAIFLILVVLFIWAYFREWKMSVAALVALFHDVAITLGIYALSGFPVTPATVTGVLAILGFSLYDTVVVFDKVKENTMGARRVRLPYAQAANLAVNQTLVRSINTSIVALIPIGAILYVSAIMLGSSSLKDLALAQFVGMAAGLYSSIFLAPRMLVQMKAGEDDVKLEERRAKARQRAAADRYSHVPARVEGEAVGTGAPAAGGDPDERYDEDEPRRGGTPLTRPSSEAVGKGRVLPEQRRPISERNPSGRKQPTRQSRSERGVRRDGQ